MIGSQTTDFDDNWRAVHVRPAAGRPGCLTLQLALWDGCRHDLPEPVWPDGHRPRVWLLRAVSVPPVTCECGVDIDAGAFSGQRPEAAAAARWESEHLPDVLGDRGRTWVFDARRTLSAAHRDALAESEATS